MNIDPLSIALSLKSKRDLKKVQNDLHQEVVQKHIGALNQKFDSVKANFADRFAGAKQESEKKITDIYAKLDSIEQEYRSIYKEVAEKTKKNLDFYADLTEKYIEHAKRIDDIQIIKGEKGEKGETPDITHVTNLVNDLQKKFDEKTNETKEYVAQANLRKEQLNKQLKELLNEGL